MRIAHVSDLHMLSLEGTTPLPFFTKRFAGFVNMNLRRRDKHPIALVEALIEDLNRTQPDEIVITGDLTNLSLDSEFRLARKMLDRIERGATHVTAVPGNHDVYTLDALLRRPFQKHFAPYASSDSGDDDFPFVRVRGPVAIIGLSSARPSPIPFASGSLGHRQRGRLEERLVELGKRGLFRVVLLHHPPVENRAFVLRGLRDRKEVQGIFARAGAELVLHGHEHRDLSVELRGPDGAIPVSGVGSGSYDDPRPERRAHYHVYDIQPSPQGHSRIVGRTVRTHDASSGRFS